MGLRLSLFKTPKHRVFNYKPLYWDPEKEELQERIKRARAEANSVENRPLSKSAPHNMIRGSFQKALYENRRHSGDNKILRVIIILSFAALLIAFFYFTKILEVILTNV